MKFWRSPLARVLLLFIVGIILPTGFLVYLGILSIHSETLLLKKESEERLGRTLQAMHDQVEAVIAASRQEMDPGKPPASWKAADGVSRFVVLDQANRLIYPIRQRRETDVPKLPPLSEPQQDRLRRAEEAEFKDKNCAPAVDDYRALERDIRSPRWKATLLNSLAGCLAKLDRLETAEAEYQEILLRYGQEEDEQGRPFGLIVGAQVGEIQSRRNRPALAVTSELKLFQDLLNDRWTLSWEDEAFFARRIQERLAAWAPAMGGAERSRWEALQDQWDKRRRAAAAAEEFMAHRWPAIERLIRQEDVSLRPLLWVDRAHQDAGLWIIPSFDPSTGQRKTLILAEMSCRDLWRRLAETLDPLATAAESVYRVTQSKSVLLESAKDPGRRRYPLEIRLTGVYPPLLLQLGQLGDLPVQKLAERRRRIYLAMVGLAAGVILIALYATWYAVSREVEVAQLKARFVASMSHELKTPLSIIGLIGQKLKLGRYSSEMEAQEYYGMLADETDRLKSLIDDVLDFSRLLENRQPYKKERGDVMAMVKDAVERCRKSHPERELDIQFIPDMPACVIAMDAEAMSRVVMNLLENAIKYSPPERLHIRITLAREGDTFVLGFKDQGFGISPDEQKLVFERFYRGASAVKYQKTNGVGLGLSIVKHIVNAHAGTVELSSAEGQGSLFTVRLPAMGEP